MTSMPSAISVWNSSNVSEGYGAYSALAGTGVSFRYA
jgi:hypothetical protein